MFGKDAAIIILFLVEWWIDGKALCCMSHLFIGYSFGCNLFQRINPRITYAITELFLLSPSNLWRQHVGKSLAYNFLLYGCA